MNGPFCDYCAAEFTIGKADHRILLRIEPIHGSGLAHIPLECGPVDACSRHYKDALADLRQKAIQFKEPATN